MTSTFEELLDASWCSFRVKILEAYEKLVSHDDLAGLKAKMVALEQELSLASAGDATTSTTDTVPGEALKVALEPFCHPSLETPKLMSIRPLMVTTEEPAVPHVGPDPVRRMEDEDRDLLGDVPRRLSECFGPVEEETPTKVTQERKKSKTANERVSKKSRPSNRRSSLQVTPLASQRVRMRLGRCGYSELLTAKDLLGALQEFGLRSFSEEDMEVLLNQLADYIDLTFVKESSNSSAGTGNEKVVSEDVANTDVDVWHDRPVRRSWAVDFQPKRTWNLCPTDAVVHLLTEPDSHLSKRIFGPKTRKQFDVIREQLQRWDPNEVVSEILQAKEANLDCSEGSTQWGLDLLTSTEAQAIRQRLRVRLGAAVTSQRLVSGRALHSAMEALGLTSYTVENMNDLVNSIADYIDLHFEVKNDGNYKRSNSPIAVFQFEFGDEDETNGFGPPIWSWPERVLTGSGTVSQAASVSPAAFETRLSYEGNPQRNYNVVPLAALMDLFMIRDYEVHRKMFSSRLQTQFEAMREILLAGDTNRLVAELTFVRINDLAAPPERMGVLLFMEPFVAILIIANGIMIGFQTHPDFSDWDGWPWLEVMFVVALVLENVLRIRLLGVRLFFCGNDRIFNWFDFFLSLTGLADLCISYLSEESDMFGVSLLRFCRLIRLVRVVKVFRLRCMKELRLMVKGLVAGFRTLCLSFVLLIAVLYVISGFATMTIGSDQRTTDLGLMIHFETIPQAMFTAFLCFAGECIDRSGRPIHTLIANEFGILFVFGYVVSYMLVSMGIFNVILAVYVDITMKAAKENDAMTAEQHARESIRIARTTRELLKKFAAAYRLYQDMDNIDQMPQLDFNTGAAPFTDNDIHAQIAITKELFLLVIQDRCVQGLMDDLDLPPDRANLFEAIDADGSGTLHVTELVQGLLQIRGEVKKSDAVATLLSTKALQNMVTDMHEEMNAKFEHMEDFVKAVVEQNLEQITPSASLKRLQNVDTS